MAQRMGALRTAVLVAAVAGASAIFGQATPKVPTLPKLPTPNFLNMEPFKGVNVKTWGTPNKQGGNAPASTGKLAPPKMPSFKPPTFTLPSFGEKKQQPNIPKMPSFAAAGPFGQKKQQPTMPNMPKMPSFATVAPLKGVNVKAWGKPTPPPPKMPSFKPPTFTLPVPKMPSFGEKKQQPKMPTMPSFAAAAPFGQKKQQPKVPKMPSFAAAAPVGQKWGQPRMPNMPSFAAAAPFGNKKQQLDPRRLAQPAVPAQKHVVGPFGTKIHLPSLLRSQLPAGRVASTKFSWGGFKAGFPQVPKVKMPKISFPKFAFGFGKARFEM